MLQTRDGRLFLGAQSLENAWMDDDEQLEIRFVPRTLAQNFPELALDFHAHGGILRGFAGCLAAH